MKIAEETLMAYADGELSGEAREEVERALAQDPELRAMLGEQQRLREVLKSHYGPVAQEEIPEKLLQTLGQGKAVGVASLAEARDKKQRPVSRLWPRYGAIAASFAVGIAAAQLLPSTEGGELSWQNGVMVAEGDLAKSLETQLASAQQPNAATRIGLTFADHQGRACRTFDASSLSGLACRDDGEWQVLLASAAERQDNEFRQASSPAVVAAAQELMAAPPLDANGERKAMAAGWNISKDAD